MEFGCCAFTCNLEFIFFFFFACARFSHLCTTSISFVNFLWHLLLSLSSAFIWRNHSLAKVWDDNDQGWDKSKTCSHWRWCPYCDNVVLVKILHINYENFQYGLHFPQKILIYILLLSTGMEEYTACNLIGLACYSTCIGSIEMLLCNRYKFLLKHSLILVSNSKVFFSKLFYAVRKSVPSFPPLYYPAILAFLYTVLGTHRP